MFRPEPPHAIKLRGSANLRKNIAHFSVAFCLVLWYHASMIKKQTTILANTPEYLEGDLRIYTMEVTQRTYTMRYNGRTLDVRPNHQFDATHWIVTENGVAIGQFDTMKNVGFALITGRI